MCLPTSRLMLPLIDWVVVLSPTQHKVGHFRDVSQANLMAWYGKLNLTTKHIFNNQKKCTTTQNKHQKELKPGLLATYDIRLGNGEGLFWFWCFINLSLTYLLKHLPTYSQLQDTHGVLMQPTASVSANSTRMPGISSKQLLPQLVHLPMNKWVDRWLYCPFLPMHSASGPDL